MVLTSASITADSGHEQYKMLEGFLSNMSMKMSESLNSLKNYNLDNFKSKYSPDYIEHNPIPSPSTTSGLKQIPNKWDLKWPIIIDNKVHWVQHVPDVEGNELLDRFDSITVVEDPPKHKRCNDREEIRRRLAMGNDMDEYYGTLDRPGRKPSLHSRLQSGMNLQICFMNETVSDNESPNSESEPNKDSSPINTDKIIKRPATLDIQPSQVGPNQKRPSKEHLTLPLTKQNEPRTFTSAADFYACQAQLQAEARLALSQAKDMARMQMEIERQRQQISPITEMVRNSMEKVGIPFPEDRRRLSRQILTEMNVAQLQVIVNDLHTQIEILNESLVKYLMDRDDLHMEQDSMLVDIEDLTRYLGAKDIGQDWSNTNTSIQRHKGISAADIKK